MSDDNTQPPAGPQGEILTAIAAAMGQVQKLAKDEKNKHDGYNFVSIDSFLALVNPICAENGLVVHMQEGEREDFTRKGKYGDNAWLRQSFVITLYHVSGQSMPPVTRTVEVLRNGAQAYGSAQSYALKQFWRCILLIPTGDKDDADFAPTDAGTVTRDAAPKREAPKPEAVAEAIEYLGDADALDDLKARWENVPDNVRRVPDVIKAKDDRKAQLQHSDNDLAAIVLGHDGAASDDLQDEIPY